MGHELHSRAPYTFGVYFDGSTLSATVSVQQVSLNAGFFTAPKAILSLVALDNLGKCTSPTGALAGYNLTVTLPSIPAHGWKSITVLLGY